MIIEQEFIEIVRTRMDAKGWSLRELSRQTGINVANLSHYMTGKRSPGADQMERILGSLGLVAHLTVQESEENLLATS